jgi:hypothetical protein
MPSTTDFPARGHVLEAADQHLVFAPNGFRYQLHLQTKGHYAGPLNVPVNGLVRGIARQLWTIPAGGNFIAPIFGSPRTVQGRLKYLSDSEIVVQAGLSIILQLPQSDMAIDLTNGQLAIGVMINAMVMPGMEFHWLDASPAAGGLASPAAAASMGTHG